MLVAPPVALASVRSSSDHPSSQPDRLKVKMSAHVVSLLIYIVSVKYHGIDKKEVYAPEHVFSLSERTANKILKQGIPRVCGSTRPTMNHIATGVWELSLSLLIGRRSVRF